MAVAGPCAAQVSDQDLAILHCDGADRDDPIGPGIQSGRFRIKNDEPHALDGRFVCPRPLEAAAIGGEECRLAHS
jgi:hypothetical protein